MKVSLLIIFVHIHKALGSLEFCIHGGMKYEDGEYFRTNGTIIKTVDPQQCVQCRCHQGLVICEVEKCPFLNCDRAIQEPQFCCRRCPDEKKAPNASSTFLMSKFHDGKSKGSGCRSDGKFYEDGSEWQPVIGPLGVMSCVKCECNKGVVGCKRYKCRELPCSHPQKEFGKCCRVCPDTDTGTQGTRAECLPKSSELFVFKTPYMGEISSIIEYAFVEGTLRTDAVHSHLWNTGEKGDRLLTVKTISHKEFLSHNLKLLGATSYRRFKKYSKREERLRLKCSNHCQKKIFRLEKALKVYLVNLRSRCNDDELDTSKIWEFSPRRMKFIASSSSSD